MKPKRHGDIPLHPYKGAVEGKEIKHNGSFVVAEGETTGHKHVVRVKNPQTMQIIKNEKGYIMSFSEGAEISHEEHKTIHIAPGTYRVGKERTKDWFSGAVRQVVD